ncbi:monovalent cation/H+ antiporter subunit D [Halochromatium salexigens]|uniref:Monovalent cation/H+ antiporter subunit D n=1 Tax=Halochromatium salexigens TaxID=49447 RepID=A0AAJ0XFL6_HALSE|nr:monovalent cation/H+ antiporter subunit D [Halochromatium salexigens]MBK5929822.1 monovalent cation/H+ antiporter subunit D [Halochromatium salexigens]
MSLLLILPLALPLGLGAWLFARSGMPLRQQRRLSLMGALGQLGAAVGLLALAVDGQIAATLIGDWPVPYGIVLAADRLSALMLSLTSALALAAIAHLSLSAADTERSGRHFHALLQLQLFGLAGAFLTADLFNLFVFFEVLLIASYGLLVQGGGPARSRAALHYVVLNMVGSSLFLMGVALLYAVTGTLSLAELSDRLPELAPDQAPLAGTGLLLLTGAFALKAALVPLHAWLVPAYSAALAPVAALFAIMTKVGVYALLRLFALMPIGDALSDAALAERLLARLPIQTVIATGALLTLAVGAVGVVVAAELRTMVAYLILVSVGTLLAGVAAGTAEGIAAGLYYLIHTTLVTAGLFLLIDVISQGRARGSWLQPAQQPPAAAWLGALFLLGALAIAGLPPLSGFVGKALILEAVQDASVAGSGSGPDWMLSWTAVLGSSLLVVIGLSRAGIAIFWQGPPSTSIASGRGAYAPTAAALLAASPLLALFAAPIAGYTQALALQLLDGEDYILAIRGLEPVDPPSAVTEAVAKSIHGGPS